MVFPLLAGLALAARLALPKIAARAAPVVGRLAARAAPFALRTIRAAPRAALTFFKTTKGKLLLGTGGALAVSPELRRFGKKAIVEEPLAPLIFTPLAPVVAGKQIGKITEAFGLPPDERGAALKKAGLIGGLVAGALVIPPIIEAVGVAKAKKAAKKAIVPLTGATLSPPLAPKIVGDIPIVTEKPVLPTNGKIVKPVSPMKISNTFKPSFNVIIQNSR